MYAKVSRKGRVTIPKSIRDHLHLDHESAVLFMVENGEVKIKSLPNKPAEALAGSLSKYATGKESFKASRKNVKGVIAKKITNEGRE